MERTTYQYDDQGMRVSQTGTTDSDNDGDLGDETPTKTLYLIAYRNPTGLAQVLEEKNASGVVTKTYTLGLDVIAQQAPAIDVNTLYLLYDGHGSTRALAYPGGEIIWGQVFAYDAFGNPIGFDPVLAATTLFCRGRVPILLAIMLWKVVIPRKLRRLCIL